ncbi:MAG: TolC family protein [Melioribacteraceae bacterium]|nr:TolC family protein [Melioribacteraceae bacterium]
MEKIFLLVCILLFSNNYTKAQTILNMDGALEIAEVNSPTIIKSKLNLERSKESLNAQNAALKSKFNLSITPFEYSKDRVFNDYFSQWNTNETKRSSGTFSISQPLKWTDGTLSLIDRFSWQDAFSEFNNDNEKSFSNNLYLSYDQPLFTYNRTMLELKELEYDLENATLSYEMQKLNLRKNVTQAFYDVYQKQQSMEISQEEYNSQKKNYDITINKVDAGILAREELYQAELNMLNSDAELKTNKVQLENALDDFKQLIGMPLDEEITIVTDITFNPIMVDLKKASEYGLNNRMELRQREIDIEASQFNIIRTSSINEFKGNLSLSVGIIGTDEKLAKIYDTPTNNQQFAVTFDVPLWDWGESDARIKAAEASLKSSQVSFEDEKISILKSIRSVYRNLNNLEMQIDISEKSVRNAELAYEINLERYKNGDLTSIDLDIFQNQLSQTKLNRISALLNYKIELLNLKIQSLWDFEHEIPVLKKFDK